MGVVGRSGYPYPASPVILLEIPILDREQPPQRDARRHEAVVRITRNCIRYRSSCVVSMVRSAKAHRVPREIVDEVRQLVNGSVAEATLIG